MNDTWYECESCSEDFKVTTSCDELPKFCPFCSHPIPEVEELDFEYD